MSAFMFIEMSAVSHLSWHCPLVIIAHIITA